MGIGNPKKILVAPLDWGLGHTTRCVPLIRYLRKAEHRVVVAGNQIQLQYLSDAFPGIETLRLEGYNITYGRTRRGFIWSIMRQVPHILRTIGREHRWLAAVHKEHLFDGIISDNRYGLYHPRVPSAILTHQLQIRTGMGPYVDGMIRRMHYSYLSHFEKCWVVDIAGKPNLSGGLAHPVVLPANGKHIGLLSQLTPEEQGSDGQHLLVLLSGPEPQRTLLSDMLWTQLEDHQGAVTFVEGAEGHRTNIPSHITYFGRINSNSLQPLLANAKLVISRSGYSTLMDLARFDKKAILIPTPGQTEQEYLGQHLKKQQIYLSIPQNRFDLQTALQQAQTFPFRKLNLADAYSLYESVLDEWLEHL